MKKIGTKTVRKIAKDLGIKTGYSWTDKIYKDENLRYICIAGVSEEQTNELRSAVLKLGYDGSPVRWADGESPSWHYSPGPYARIAKCVFEKQAEVI